MTVANLHHLAETGANQFGDAIAIVYKDECLSFEQLQSQVSRVGTGLAAYTNSGDRIAIYLPKMPQTVVASLAISAATCVLVPINPVLKAPQVQHIVNDSEASVLITQASRLAQLSLMNMQALKTIILLEDNRGIDVGHCQLIPWQQLLTSQPKPLATVAKTALCALLYTSGSTGLPKGVMLSHNNLLLGAKSVAAYLQLSDQDRVLAVLPFSFDYGFNQLLSSLLVGAQCVLLDYLLPNDIPKACARYGITGLAAVPPLWLQLADTNWPEEAKRTLRYFTNSGGHMPRELMLKLKHIFHKANPVLMYGLTEAFRSSYVPLEYLDTKVDSMGIAIPYADLYVINQQQQQCKPHEVGELVHAGPLVAMGYWQQKAQTEQRFRPLPVNIDTGQTMAVWSGDSVYQDKDGFLYFKGRMDNQIKVSGYRISPEELETALLAVEGVEQTLILAESNKNTGQAIIAVITPKAGCSLDEKTLIIWCRKNLPNYMMPARWLIVDDLPKNANGKLDRQKVKETLL